MSSTDNLSAHSFDGNRLSHAYIVSSGLTDDLAMAFVCSGSGLRPCHSCTHCDKALKRIHPDITDVFRLRDKREIAVDQIRDLKKDVFITPNESDKKAYIIHEADLMNTAAQNALLQILEEPPPHAVFVLRTENPAALLPTVRSRCVEIKAQPGDKTYDSTATEMAKDFLTALEGGNESLVRIMFRLEKLDRNGFADFLNAVRGRMVALLREAASDDVVKRNELFSQTERLLIKSGEWLELNINVGHISGMLCAGLIEKGRSFDRSC